MSYPKDFDPHASFNSGRVVLAPINGVIDFSKTMEYTSEKHVEMTRQPDDSRDVYAMISGSMEFAREETKEDYNVMGISKKVMKERFPPRVFSSLKITPSSEIPFHYKPNYMQDMPRSVLHYINNAKPDIATVELTASELTKDLLDNDPIMLTKNLKIQDVVMGNPIGLMAHGVSGIRLILPLAVILMHDIDPQKYTDSFYYTGGKDIIGLY